MRGEEARVKEKGWKTGGERRKYKQGKGDAGRDYGRETVILEK